MFIHRHKVQFYETDLMGIVHHTNYLRFFEEARVSWAHAKGMLDYQKPEAAAHFAVLETEVRHLLPAFFGDDLEIEIQAKMTGVRITFEYKMYCRSRSQGPVAQGRTQHAPLDSELRPIRPPDHIRLVFKEEPWIETWL